MTTPKNYFALLNEEDKNWIFTRIFPTGMILKSPRQQEAWCRMYCYRHIFTGQMDELGGATSGMKVLKWWYDYADVNLGLGPLTACGTMVHAYSALMAALGFYTRLVGATSWRELEGAWIADNQVEYWDTVQNSWVFVNLGCNCLYTNPDTGTRLSYLTMSTIARNGETSFYRSSPTGGIALHPGGDHYGFWEKFITDAVISNGNAAFLDKPHDWQLFRIWPPKDGVDTIWQNEEKYIVDSVPKHILYPVPV